MRIALLLVVAVLQAVPLFWSVYAADPAVTVYKDPFCGCCGLWVEHLRKNGFQVTVHEVENVAPYKKEHGVPTSMQSCHTAIVDGYTIEGHVPAGEVQRLLKERPGAKGLAVPGMPMGSPGMEGARVDAYKVMLFDTDGTSSVYKEYPER
jgi:hypothetical protein